MTQLMHAGTSAGGGRREGGRAGARESAARFDLPLTTAPMEALLARELPATDGPWQFEPKWDGFRCLAFKAGATVELRAKSGKPLGRFFPEVVEMLRRLPSVSFVLDGELLLTTEADGMFDALQMRLHPAASRIQRLSQETPARLMAFDLLAADGVVLMDRPLQERRARLESFVAAAVGGRAPAAPAERLAVSPATTRRATAQHWLQASGQGGTDGVVAKRLDGAYEPGRRAMIKVKPLRSADCVVGGFRYARGSRLVGSLLLGLYDEDGRLDHVGFTATIRDSDREALTHRLEALRKPPGFTGSAPGGPSRWSRERSTAWEPLRPKLVVEVCFDQVTANRFRHGTTLLRWRPDKAPQQCTLEQLRPPQAATRNARAGARPSARRSRATSKPRRR